MESHGHFRCLSSEISNLIGIDASVLSSGHERGIETEEAWTHQKQGLVVEDGEDSWH